MKMVKKIAALACSAVVAFGLMSCHTNDIGNGSAVVTEDVDVTSNVKTLIVKLSRVLKSGETLKYNGVTVVVNGTTVTIEGAADGGKLVLSGGNLIEQSTTINFGNSDVVAIDLDVLEESTGITIQDVTSESDPDQSAEDNLDGATASISVKAGAIMNNSSLKNQKFSITLYTPAVSPLTAIKTGAAEVAPLAAKCRPAGLTFNPAVAFEANLPGADGCEVYCKDAASYQYEGTKLTASLAAFKAVHEIPMKYNITSIVEEKNLIASGTVPAGPNVISYKKKYGFESNATGIVARLFRQLFGAAAGSTTKSFGIETEGETTYDLYQHVKNVTIKSGSAEFNVKIYGEVTADLISAGTTTEPEVVPTHNGGSND